MMIQGDVDEMLLALGEDGSDLPPSALGFSEKELIEVASALDGDERPVASLARHLLACWDDLPGAERVSGLLVLANLLADR